MEAELVRVTVRGVTFVMEADAYKEVAQAGRFFVKRENRRPVLHVGRRRDETIRVATLLAPSFGNVIHEDGDSTNLRRGNLIDRAEWNRVNIKGVARLGKLMQRVATLSRELGRFGKKLEVKDVV